MNERLLCGGRVKDGFIQFDDNLETKTHAVCTTLMLFYIKPQVWNKFKGMSRFITFDGKSDIS